MIMTTIPTTTTASTTALTDPAAAEIPGPMRRAVAEPNQGVRLETAPIPTPAPGQALVRSTLIGICGSDTHAIAGQHPFLTSRYLPGHEATGTVIALGDGVAELTVGSAAAQAECRLRRLPELRRRPLQCRREPDLDRVRSVVGVGGAMADYFVAPERTLFPAPDGVDDPTAALVEHLATPVHAVRIAGEIKGSRVVGWVRARSVRCASWRPCTPARPRSWDRPGSRQLERAKRAGAHGAVQAGDPDVNEQVLAELGGPADVVLDCVTNQRSLNQAVALLRRAGTLAVVGVPPRDATLPMPLIQDWKIRIQGCAAYTEADMQTALTIAADGGLPTDEIVSRTFGLDEVDEAFAQAKADSSGKVLVTPAR